MRRTFGLALAAAALALSLGCGKSGSPTSGPGPAGIEGGWTLVSVESEGKKNPPPAELPEAEKKFRATADKLYSTKNKQEESIRYKLDPSKSPPEVELTSDRKDGTSETMYGIYKLEGDTLTLCVVPSADPADRPKEFKTAPGSKVLIMTLKKD